MLWLCDNIFVVIMFFQVRLTLEIGKKWKQGEITDIGDVTPPDQPSRDEKLNVVAPGKEKRRGKGGSLVSNILYKFMKQM